MRRAAFLLALVPLAAGCGGGKPAASAAEVIPASASAVVSLPPQPELPVTRRALALLPGGSRLQTLLDRTGWARAAGERVEVALLPNGGVAFLEAKLDKQFALPHVRVHGWTAFALRESLLDEVKHAKRHLDDSGWYARGVRAIGPMEVTAVRRDVAFGADGATVRRAVRGGRTDGELPVGLHVPADAVAAAVGDDLASRAGAFRNVVESGLGLSEATLAAAVAREAAAYVRTGAPVPATTLVVRGVQTARIRAVVDELAGVHAITEPATLDGRPATLAALSALDLWFGRRDGNAFLTDDPAFHLDPADVLRPDGLPERVSSYLYLDVARGVPALSTLAALAGTRLSRRFTVRLAGLATVLAYTTHTAAATRLTVVVS
jgi:hypothetical protein